jgi:hypothetical protein
VGPTWGFLPLDLDMGRSWRRALSVGCHFRATPGRYHVELASPHRLIPTVTTDTGRGRHIESSGPDPAGGRGRDPELEGS